MTPKVREKPAASRKRMNGVGKTVKPRDQCLAHARSSPPRGSRTRFPQQPTVDHSRLWTSRGSAPLARSPGNMCFSLPGPGQRALFHVGQFAKQNLFVRLDGYPGERFVHLLDLEHVEVASGNERILVGDYGHLAGRRIYAQVGHGLDNLGGRGIAAGRFETLEIHHHALPGACVALRGRNSSGYNFW